MPMAKLLGVEHLATLALIAAVIATLIVAARLRPGSWTVVASRVLAVVIVANVRRLRNRLRGSPDVRERS